MYLNKTVFLVVGISRSGVSATEFLLSEGANCYICDELDSDSVKASIARLKLLGAKPVSAEEAIEIIEEIDVVVMSPGVPIDNRIPLSAKRVGKRIIGEMELGYLFSSSPIVAVTGTNGKTTTCSLIGGVLERAGISRQLVGNMGVPFTSKIKELNTSTVAVTEVSSFQLETLFAFTPHVAVVTNISEDHLSRHYNMQNYVFLKSKILHNLKESEYAVLNYDDYVVRGFSEKTKGKIVYFSAKEVVDGAYLDGDTIYYKGNAVMDARLIRLKGEHNLYNVLACVAVCKILGISDNDVAEGIIEFKGIRHRVEFVRSVGGVDFYNDSKATNVDSTLKAIDSMSKPTVLLLGGRDKGQNFDGLFKACKDEKIVKVILFGESRYKLLKSAERAELNCYCLATNVCSAVKLAYAEAVEGQNVLLSPACSSFDEFAGFEERGIMFTEIVNGLDG